MINWTNVTDFNEIPGLANTATDGVFWTGMLYMFYIVMIMVTSVTTKSFIQALLISSFSCLIIGMFLVYAGLVNFIYLLSFFGVMLLCIIYLGWKEK